MPNDRRRRPGDTRPLTVQPRDARRALLDQLAQWRITRPDLVQLIESETARGLGVDVAAIGAWCADALDDAGLRDLLDSIATRAASAP